MSKRVFFLVLSFFLCEVSSASAGERTLRELIDSALKNNPQIHMAQARYEVAKAKIPQASSLADPRFDFKYDTMVPRMVAMESDDPGATRVFGVSQEIPFPTKLLLKAQIAAKESQMTYADYKEKENEIISMVKSLFAELSFLYKSIEIIKENKVLLEQLHQAVSSRFSLNRASQQDVLKVQVEIARMDNELVLLEARRQVAQAKLNTLLSQDPSTELGEIKISEEPTSFPELQELNKTAKEHRQELLSFRLAVQRAKKMVALARQEYLPDFMIRYERMERAGHLKELAGMVGVTLPVWFWQKQNFNVKEMKSDLKAMEASYKNEENQVLLEVKEDYAQLQAYKKLLELYKTSYLPQAEQTLKASLTGYEANEVDFLNVLDSQRMLLDFKLDYYKVLIDYEVTSADLELRIGKPLDGGSIK
ncbi:MAG: TolC family protein [Candidatus Omnitrophota bacterium]